MKRALPFLPLLGIAPAAHFLGAYLVGADILSVAAGLFIGVVSMFLLPWAVAALFAAMVRVAWPIRVLLFIGALVAQAVFLFKVVPVGAISEMMGFAHRIRLEFPPDQIRDCAASILRKERNGTLIAGRGDRGHSFLMSRDAVTVDDSELPASLRKRFDRVFIQQDDVTGEDQVFFSLDERTGIVCDRRKSVREFFVYSMAEGVHAYRYRRL